jgi:TonB family protein
MAVPEATEYPEAARRQGIEGTVVVEFLVLPDGSITKMQITKPVHPLLNKAAVRAIQKVEFEPGTYRGKPVPALKSLPVSFHIR